LGYANAKGLWSALYAPSKTPQDVLETIHKGTVAALKSAAVQEAFKKQMIKATPDATLADAKTWAAGETAYWKKLTETVKVEKPE
jgi:tripartite-type tricarboxylate transporter receptor subunit TctC